MALYDDEKFFESYARMPRSEGGLESAGEWWQLSRLLPGDMSGMRVLDVGCGYGWHCKYAAGRGADYVLGFDPSERMLAEARRRYAEEHAKDDRGLAERADAARDASGSMEKGAPRPLGRESR